VKNFITHGGYIQEHGRRGIRGDPGLGEEENVEVVSVNQVVNDGCLVDGRANVECRAAQRRGSGAVDRPRVTLDPSQ
jgi:hypothetical protein